MIIDINEEEMEFLYRMCSRAQALTKILGRTHVINNENDAESIARLIEKLRDAEVK